MNVQEKMETEQVRLSTTSKSNLLRELVPRFMDEARTVLDAATCRKVRRVFAGGSGDSHHAALAAEMMFESVAGVPMEAQSGLPLGRYAIPDLDPEEAAHTLVMTISLSGRVVRTIEVLRLARDRGALTVALTGNPQSALAEAAELVFNTTIPEPDDPGVRTYMSSVTAMMCIALHLGEMRGRLSKDDSARWQAHMLHTADVMDATNEAISEESRRLAQTLRDQQQFVFVGSGPNFGTALFGAAKIIETTGRHAYGQDTEEWAHLQRYNRDHGTPQFLIAPPGRAHGRSAELADIMRRTNKYVVAVCEKGDEAVAGSAHTVLPIVGHVPEPLSPLVYANPLEVFASDLAFENKVAYFCDGVEPYAVPNEPYIRGSKAYRTLDELRAAEAQR